MAQLQFNLIPERKVWKVAELNARIRELLSAAFTNIWIEGEISNFREAQSGHLYFTLKDESSQIRCVSFRQNAIRLRFRPEDGLHARLRGSVSVYDARGEYQIYVEHIEPVGLGALQLAFEQLKKKLEAEGLFDASRKRPLPVLPGRIGVITSPRAAALRDILRILRRRFPNARVLIYPVRVQGEGAAEDIVKALKFFSARDAADVLILARGGGSLEDLWPFNEEAVARAIAASAVPVISAVGHETDFTIADFVADVRASTPSAAAEIVVQERDAFDHHLAEVQRKLADSIRYLILERRHRLQLLLGDRALRRPEEMLREFRQRVDEQVQRLAELVEAKLHEFRSRFTDARARMASFDLRLRLEAMRLRTEHRAGELRLRIERLLTQKRQRFERLMLQLDERSPLRVLERGYSIAYDSSGTVLRSVEGVSAGDEISLRLARGKLFANVTRSEP
ncbi:MAG TPA: exodeoxyribonuclease VII large subunit [Candidatus Acidoferrales bacterium]|nr:exodeoxyribonuclease VII large subunit [Candidatus Acidoferrales bacterium]